MAADRPPTLPATPGPPTMKWITRSNVKVDRVACPWLIRRFIDPQAEFLFVEEAEIEARAAAAGATPFDVPRNPRIHLNHRPGQCTFEAILDDYHLDDPALRRLGLIVHGADLAGELDVCPEAAGLKAAAEGFASLGLSDQQRLELEFPLYDALLAYCRKAVKSNPDAA